MISQAVKQGDTQCSMGVSLSCVKQPTEATASTSNVSKPTDDDHAMPIVVTSVPGLQVSVPALQVSVPVNNSRSEVQDSVSELLNGRVAGRREPLEGDPSPRGGESQSAMCLRGNSVLTITLSLHGSPRHGMDASFPTEQASTSALNSLPAGEGLFELLKTPSAI